MWEVAEQNAEHGEMTLLGKLHAAFTTKKNPGTDPIVKDLGGVKKACAICNLAYEAYNLYLGPEVGYRIKYSGTHGGFYPGWKAPDFIAANKDAMKYIRDGVARAPKAADGRKWELDTAMWWCRLGRSQSVRYARAEMRIPLNPNQSGKRRDEVQRVGQTRVHYPGHSQKHP